MSTVPTVKPDKPDSNFLQSAKKFVENIHKAARQKAAEKFILSGRLICAECGELMVGESGTSKTCKIHIYYKCADNAVSLDNMKRLFDVFIKEVIFDGEKYLIVLKTSNMPDIPTTNEQKEKSRAECDELRTRFETFRFGEADYCK